MPPFSTSSSRTKKTVVLPTPFHALVCAPGDCFSGLLRPRPTLVSPPFFVGSQARLWCPTASEFDTTGSVARGFASAHP